MQLASTTYDKLKWITIVFLPAFITFLGVILGCFDVPFTDTILTILGAFQLFLGTILGISCHNYNKE